MGISEFKKKTKIVVGLDLSVDEFMIQLFYLLHSRCISVDVMLSCIGIPTLAGSEVEPRYFSPSHM